MHVLHRNLSKTIFFNPKEESVYIVLISDNARTMCQSLLEEFSLKDVDLSTASNKSIFFSLILLLFQFNNSCTYCFLGHIFTTCEVIKEFNKFKEEKKTRQKRAGLNKDPLAKPHAPIFLGPHFPKIELGDDGGIPPRGPFSGPIKVLGKVIQWLGPPSIRWIGLSTPSLLMTIRTWL